MNNWEDDLKKKYPNFFRYMNEENRNEVCWPFFECGEGWSHLIECVAFAAENTGVYCVQVKEKFGELRIYCDGHNESVSCFVQAAEALSKLTCENCGKFSGGIKPLKGGWWLKSFCKECRDAMDGKILHEPGGS